MIFKTQFINPYTLSLPNHLVLFPVPYAEMWFVFVVSTWTDSISKSPFHESHWELEISYCGGIYTTEIGRCCRSGCFPQEVQLLNTPQHHSVPSMM